VSTIVSPILVDWRSGSAMNSSKAVDTFSEFNCENPAKGRRSRHILAHHLSRFDRFMIRLSKYILSIVAVLCNLHAASQELSARDSRFIDQLRTELALDSVQQKAVDTLFWNSHLDMNVVAHEVDSLERADISEEILNLKIAVLNQKKKDIREYRELGLMDVLTREQQTIYSKRIKPSKPQVLHFGIHDRAKCNVCIK